MSNSIGKRLEAYSSKRPQEVLLVNLDISGEEDQVTIFKGFSSSLMRPTAFDADVPVIPDDAKITTIDRISSPYNPEAPSYIQQGLTWEDMQALLAKLRI